LAELNPTAASLLGFLHGGPASGYDLVGIAELVIGDFWSLTRSQVYRELADLARRGLIEAQPAGPRAKRPYELTDAGREAFAAWMAEPPGTEQIRYPLLLALSFGSLIDRDRLLGYVETHRAIHGQRLAAYRDLKAAGDMDQYVMATIAFGIRYEEGVLAWIADLPGILAEHGEPAQN
jgi:DNA-binding PadR family transcriptional regulator